MNKRHFLPVLCVVLAILITGCVTSVPKGAETDTEDIRAEDPASRREEQPKTDEEAPDEDETNAGAQNEGTAAPNGTSEPIPEKSQNSHAPNEDGAEGGTPAEPETVRTLSGARPSTHGALHVEGTRLTGADGTPVQLKGVSTHGLSWYPAYVNDACFKELSEDWGVNAVRLAMYTAEYGGYCTGGDQQALKKLLRQGVDYATAHDMYVIVDWHILSDGDPNTYKAEAITFFREMSAAFSGYDNVLYEICNEPNGGTSWSAIKAYAQEVIPAIRANDPDAVILVGTPNWSQYVDEAAKDPITGYDNILYTLHFYAATHRDSLRSAMVNAMGAGLPVFVSEYGICDASGSGAIDAAEADRWVSAMDAYGVSYMMWNLSNKNESSAILKDSCAKTSGFTMEDLSEAGKWLLTTLDGAPAALTEPEPGPENIPGTTDGQPPQSGGISGLTCMVQMVNSWESNGESYYQYNVTFTNDTGRDLTGWQVELLFNGEFTLRDSWNGDYSVAGRTLTITNKDYNGVLAPGGSAADIGFIISGTKDLKLA